jgi:heptaprenyl diphosphate synthase
MLTAVALTIFVVELRFPDIVPIPGVKLGLANIITVYAVYHYRAWETAMLVFVRVFLGSLFGGGVSAMLYSMTGAAFCLIGMLVIRCMIPQNYIWLSSIIGAMLHNTGQIAAAVVLMRSTAVVGYLPILLVTGSIAGFCTGMCAQILIKKEAVFRHETS